MQIVFNELSSYGSESCTTHQSRELINQFVVLLHKLRTKCNLQIFTISGDVYSLQFGPGYKIVDWLSDSDVPKSNKDLLKSVLSRASFVDRDNSIDEFELYGQSASGCLIAYREQLHVLSFSVEKWTHAELKGIYRCLAAENITESEATINNIFSEDQIEYLATADREQMKSNISSARDLWSQRNTLYSHLVFCDSVENQLLANPSLAHLSSIMKRLDKLEHYFATYSGTYNQSEFSNDASTESKTVKTDPVLKEMRRFQKPSGEYDYFYDHIGFSGPYCGRIHYSPDDATRKCYIDYIGKHLKTKKF